MDVLSVLLGVTIATVVNGLIFVGVMRELRQLRAEVQAVLRRVDQADAIRRVPVYSANGRQDITVPRRDA